MNIKELPNFTNYERLCPFLWAEKMLDIYIPVHSILKMRQYILFVIVFLSSVCVMVFPVDESLAQQNIDITKGNSTVWLGGEKIGTLSIRFEDYGGPNIPGGLVNITSQLNMSPPDGGVFEGWLLDPIFNTYNNLSLGQFLNNRLNFDQFMVNPDLYEYFVVSEEPLNDRESRISNIIAGGTRVDIVPNDTIAGGAQINSP
jgi:hypothetical protein